VLKRVTVQNRGTSTVSRGQTKYEGSKGTIGRTDLTFVEPINNIVVVQRCELCYFFIDGKMKLYIEHAAKFDCLYRHLGPNSDVAANFLTCTSLISQQIFPTVFVFCFCF
jgi:hypothetical protein